MLLIYQQLLIYQLNYSALPASNISRRLPSFNISRAISEPPISSPCTNTCGIVGKSDHAQTEGIARGSLRMLTDAKDIFAYIGKELDDTEIDEILVKYNDAKDITKNENRKEKPALTDTQKKILITELSETCLNLGYEAPHYVEL